MIIVSGCSLSLVIYMCTYNQVLFCICACTCCSNYKLIYKTVTIVLISFPDSPKDLAWPWHQPAPPPHKNSSASFFSLLYSIVVYMANCRQSKSTWSQGRLNCMRLPLPPPPSSITHCRLIYTQTDPFLLPCSENCTHCSCMA